MRAVDMFRLLVLSAIWGGSFILMRVISPVLGPFVTTDLRVLVAGTALMLYAWAFKRRPRWRENWAQYLLIGIVNSAVPFTLFSFAALHIPASYSVVLTATSPLFGAIFSSIWLGEAFTQQKFLGILLGSVGVALIARVGSQSIDSFFAISVAACLGASSCYALSGIYIKKYAGHLSALEMSSGTQIMAGLALLPLAILNPPTGEVTPLVISNLLGLSLVGSALAYLLYFRLIADVGPSRALTVTFLMPVFGMLWGAIFLDETITWLMIFGAVLIVSGTKYVVSAPRTLFVQNKVDPVA